MSDSFIYENMKTFAFKKTNDTQVTNAARLFPFFCRTIFSRGSDSDRLVEPLLSNIDAYSERAVGRLFWTMHAIIIFALSLLTTDPGGCSSSISSIIKIEFRVLFGHNFFNFEARLPSGFKTY